MKKLITGLMHFGEFFKTKHKCHYHASGKEEWVEKPSSKCAEDIIRTKWIHGRCCWCGAEKWRQADEYGR